MSDNDATVRAPRRGRRLARATVLGATVLALSAAGVGSAFAHEGEDHGEGGTGQGKPDQPKKPGTVHGLVDITPVYEAAKPAEELPVAGNAVTGFKDHMDFFHSVSLGDYVENNAEDPLGYSVGTHVDMTEHMLGAPGAFDKEQEMLGATPKPEFQH
jgi:hypothetical protein